MLAKLVKFAELCCIFEIMIVFRDIFFLKNVKHRVFTGETAETSVLPEPKFRLIHHKIAPNFSLRSPTGEDALIPSVYATMHARQLCR
jgi:hypothetical protein